MKPHEHNPSLFADLREAQAHGDSDAVRDALDAIVRANFWLVYRALGICGKCDQDQEEFSEAQWQFLRAILYFDPTRASFAYFAIKLMVKAVRLVASKRLGYFSPGRLRRIASDSADDMPRCTARLVDPEILKLLPGPDAPDTAVINEQIGYLEFALEENFADLSPSERLALLGHYRDGRPMKEIAREMGVSHQAAHGAGYRSLAKMRRALAGLAAVALVVTSLGCSALSPRVSQQGTGNTSDVDASTQAVRIDKLLTAMDLSFKAVESLKAEIRAGTQEQKADTTAGRDAAAVNTQQGGFFNLSFGEAATAGGGALAIGLWLYAMRKQGERESQREREADREETNRVWISGNVNLRMAGHEPLPSDYKPLPVDDPCRRSWWPFAKCGRSA